MAEKQTPPTSYDQAIDQSLAIAAQAGPAPDDFFMQHAVKASRESVQAPARTPRAPEARPRTSRAPEVRQVSRLSRRQAIGTGLALAAGLTAGVIGLHSEAGGNNSPDRGELDPTVHSIILDPGANLRNDPFLGEIPNNVANPLSDTVIVETPHGVRVENNTNNGTWYGIEKEDLAAAIPAIAKADDKDAIIWVNEQGVASIDHE